MQLMYLGDIRARGRPVRIGGSGGQGFHKKVFVY
jgi:hypothetical protein